jgi:hypothetical protein
MGEAIHLCKTDDWSSWLTVQAAIESNGRLTRRDVYELASTNLENLMGLKGVDDDMADLVAYDGGSAFDLSSKVVAVLCPMRGVVDLMQ